LLQKLERGQFVPGVTVIALSEHVDYWNHLGWSDPFSSAQMTSRQQTYATRLRAEGPYTPQMVVDGVEEFVGSDAARARRALEAASRHPKLDLTGEMTSPGTLHITVPASPAAAEVLVAVVYDPEPSAVARGENSGRHLTHISVVKSMKKVGDVGRNKVLDTRVTLPEGPQLNRQRTVIFLQERGQGRVLACTEVGGPVTTHHSAGIVAQQPPQK
jgi:hypothetical protein